MTNYDIFAKFYDAVMGNREKTAVKIHGFIRLSNPKAKSVLELACGTGAVLKYLAKKEVPQAKLYHQSMTGFKVSEKFDVILCVFDSINHLLKFGDWEKLFASAQKYLNDDGVFIFDVNTKVKLTRHSSEPTWVRKFGESYMLMKVQNMGKEIFNWNVKIFENQKGKQYKLWEEDIKEINFPLKKLRLL